MQLPKLPSVADLIRLYGLSAKSQLSQNFILDLNVTNRLIAPAKLKDAIVIEVGSGPGALTRSILEAGPKKVFAIEKDRRFLPSLQLLAEAAEGRMQVVHHDILTLDYTKLLAPLVKPQPWSEPSNGVYIIGNLPFNISTRLLVDLVHDCRLKRGVFGFGRTHLLFTFQHEVAERIVAKPGTSDRSRLSLLVQHAFAARYHYHMPNTVFVPPPKVQVGGVYFAPLEQPMTAAPIASVELVAQHILNQRGKFISNGVGRLVGGNADIALQLLEQAKIPPTTRVSNVSTEQFAALVDAYEAHLQSPLAATHGGPMMSPSQREAKRIKLMHRLERLSEKGAVDWTELRPDPSGRAADDQDPARANKSGNVVKVVSSRNAAVMVLPARASSSPEEMRAGSAEGGASPSLPQDNDEGVST
ncbi:dimethyladenosine transferase 1, partial [Capsaspora owczarzaki ATCC 30864]|uniref:dimethyladenosine transferase 1 n=1 Tax=Capsaspora owczarzaki (strain ATCC 30864) TaxID=595528 RepID=UPI000352601D